MKSKGNNLSNLTTKAEGMLLKADGEIRQLGIIHHSSVSTSSFENTVKAVLAANTITENAFVNNRPVEIILEGKSFNAKARKVTDLSELNAQNVSVVVAMDKELAVKPRYFDSNTKKSYELADGDVIDTEGKVTNPATGTEVKATVVVDTVGYTNTAAVGVLLGAVSKAKVSENIAWIEKFNLTGEGFRSVGFIGGKEPETEGALKSFDEAKYIFTRTHIGVSGVYFNDSHTCTAPTSDFTFIEANRTINKAARIARTALLPKVNSPVLVDPDTGTLPPSTVKGFESLCRAALERMLSNEEVSAIDVFVDPQQDILADSILKIQIEIVPLGTARRIVVDLGFKNPFGIAA